MATTLSVARRRPTAAAAGRRRRARAAAALLFPFFLLFSGVTLIPIGYAAYLSLFRTEHSGLGFGPAVTVFDGIGQYLRLLEDSAFRGSFVDVALYGLVFVPVMLAAALGLALLLDSGLAKAARFFHVTYYLPHVVPPVLASLLWLYLYTPKISPVINALSALGAKVDLNHNVWLIPAMANIGVWQATGFNIVIFYAALKAIPREVLEASLVDGATGWRTAVSIKIPLIGPAVTFAGLMTLVGVLQVFDQPLVMQIIAPGAIGPSWSPNLSNYNAAFADQDFASAAAGSIILVLLSGVLAFVVMRVTRKWRDV